MEEPLGLEYYRQHYRDVMPEMFAAVSDLYAEYCLRPDPRALPLCSGGPSSAGGERHHVSRAKSKEQPWTRRRRK